MAPRSPSSVLQWNHIEPELEYDDCSTFEKRSVKGTIPLVKSVTFAGENEVQEITHIDDIPDEEVAAIWYEAQEYADMKLSYKDTVFLMECGKELDEVEHTARGLEYRTQEGAWARYENKRDAYNAVLDEQDLQWKEDKDDDEAIRRVYQEHSLKCRESALAVGLQDARLAQKIHFNFDSRPTLPKKSKSFKMKVARTISGSSWLGRGKGKTKNSS
jgi:hypothetical protein